MKELRRTKFRFFELEANEEITFAAVANVKKTLQQIKKNVANYFRHCMKHAASERQETNTLILCVYISCRQEGQKSKIYQLVLLDHFLISSSKSSWQKLMHKENSDLLKGEIY